MSRGSMRTTQQIHLSFDLNTPTELTITGSEARELNNSIIDILYDYSNCENDFELELYDIGFNEDFGENLYDVAPEFILMARITIVGDYSYDPGIYAYPNGDPGYPPSSEWDPAYGWIEDIDTSKVAQELIKLPKIGEYIDVSSVKISINEPDETQEIEVDDYDTYDEW